MERSRQHAHKQHDAATAIENLRRVIERLDYETILHVVKSMESDGLEALRIALASLSDAVEQETFKREDLGLLEAEHGR